jgi:hypothetical protein
LNIVPILSYFHVNFIFLGLETLYSTGQGFAAATAAVFQAFFVSQSERERCSERQKVFIGVFREKEFG